LKWVVSSHHHDDDELSPQGKNYETPEMFLYDLVQYIPPGELLPKYTTSVVEPYSMKPLSFTHPPPSHQEKLLLHHSSCWSVEDIEQFTHRLIGYLQSLYSTHNIKIHQSSFKDGRDIELHASGIPCPTKGRAHKSNTTYVHLQLSPCPNRELDDFNYAWMRYAHVFCVCTDVECQRAARWYVGNLSRIIFI
jgi:hypothetical protein